MQKKVTGREKRAVQMREAREQSNNNREQCWPSKCASLLSSTPHSFLCSLAFLFMFRLHGHIYLMLPEHSMSQYWFLFPLLCWWVFDAGVQGYRGLCCGPLFPFPQPHSAPSSPYITKTRCLCLPPTWRHGLWMLALLVSQSGPHGGLWHFPL